MLFLTYKMYRRGWKAPTWICALLGVIAILGTQGWVQGFIKTHILTLGYEYGEQLNKFHETVGKIEDTVRKHQTRLDEHQTDIERQQGVATGLVYRLLQQQRSISKQQSTLNRQQEILSTAGKAVAQTATDISDQQRRLNSVETLVDNIYTRTRIDVMRGTDSNRVCYAVRGSNAVFGVFLLKDVPIANSIQGYFDNLPLKPGIIAFGNVATTVLVGKQSEWEGHEYSFSYVADPRRTNRISRIETRDGVAFADGAALPLPRE